MTSNRSSRSITDHGENEHQPHQFTINNDHCAQHFKLNPQQQIKKADTQYRARKHRRRKSGSGSLSSSENKLECLEEEESNMLPEDDNGISTKENRSNTSTPIQELRRKMNQSRNSNDDNCEQKQKQGLSAERVKMSIMKHSKKKREKKNRENLQKLEQPPNSNTTSDTIMDSDFPYLCGTNIHLGRNRKGKKNKEMCAIM